MKPDRAPMRMNHLKDPEIEWDEIRNRGMCKFIVWYALYFTIAVVGFYWLFS